MQNPYVYVTAAADEESCGGGDGGYYQGYSDDMELIYTALDWPRNLDAWAVGGYAMHSGEQWAVVMSYDSKNVPDKPAMFVWIGSITVPGNPNGGVVRFSSVNSLAVYGV